MKNRILPIILILAALLAASLYIDNVIYKSKLRRTSSDTKPKGPVKVELTLENISNETGVCEIKMNVQPLIDARMIKVFYEFSEGIKILDGEAIWEGKVTFREQKEFRLRLGFPKDKYCQISSIAELHTFDGQIFKGSDYLEINTDSMKKLLKESPVIDMEGRKVIRKRGIQVKDL